MAPLELVPGRSRHGSGFEQCRFLETALESASVDNGLRTGPGEVRQPNTAMRAVQAGAAHSRSVSLYRRERFADGAGTDAARRMVTARMRGDIGVVGRCWLWTPTGFRRWASLVMIQPEMQALLTLDTEEWDAVGGCPCGDEMEMYMYTCTYEMKHAGGLGTNHDVSVTSINDMMNMETMLYLQLLEHHNNERTLHTNDCNHDLL
ncbi:hypothetical protein LTR53_013131 [Teratosphaeriaceae sp. CCFEE 6253]|nr:hypothetical protein LTR53_013131 [Teratosphaeriaceae sp. CCFEE 6253]